jgi:hypothetical protein
MKGQKRFKVKGGNVGVGDNAALEELNTSNAKDYFRKKMAQTSYCSQFGDRPKAAEAYSILKSKKFSDLPFQEILKPDVTRILSAWLQTNDQDLFTGRIFFTVREMYTVIKAQAASVSTSLERFQVQPKFQKGDPVNYDQILKTIVAERRKNSY